MGENQYFCGDKKACHERQWQARFLLHGVLAPTPQGISLPRSCDAASSSLVMSVDFGADGYGFTSRPMKRMLPNRLSPIRKTNGWSAEDEPLRWR